MRCEICGCDCCPNDLPCDRPTSQPMGFHRFGCAACGCIGDFLEYARTGQEPTKEKKQMEIGKYVEVNARNPFIDAKDVSARGSKFKITNVQTAPKGMKYSDIVVTLQGGKKLVAWGLSFAYFTCSELVARFGSNTDKWIGKTITLIKVPGKKKGQFYINLAQ